MAKYIRTHQMATGGGNVLQRYQDLIVGSRSLGRLFYFELCMLFANMRGALGLFLRKLFWPRLFGSCGQGVLFGAGVVLRHPRRIHLGTRVVISEGCVLDARNTDTERAMVLGEDVNLANNVILSVKQGRMSLGARVGIGVATMIQSAVGNPVSIGDDVVVGPQCYIVGGSDYNTDRLDIPICSQGIKPDGGVEIEGDVWLGAKVSVLGGAKVASGAVAATGAVIVHDVPFRAVVAGAPAKVLKVRGQDNN